MKRLSGALLFAIAAFAQPPVKPVPAAGIAIPAADRAELQAGLAHLQTSIARLKPGPLLPDVQIYSEAVRFSLEYNEFFKPAEIAAAKVLLQQGEERATQLAAGQAPWTTATGLVVRGYVSRIDKSVQPYGLVVPPSYSPNAPHRWRLDTWFHGRDETLTQVNFITARQKSAGEFTPRDTIVLHLYGRYCNASKFAGEVDLFEALDAVKRNYPIDENRLLVRGFSMGGATRICYTTNSNYSGDLCLMAQVCDICGRGPQFGNRISHAHNVTKRRWNINLQSVRALVKGAGKRLKVCTSCIRDGKVQKVA